MCGLSALRVPEEESKSTNGGATGGYSTGYHWLGVALRFERVCSDTWWLCERESASRRVMRVIRYQTVREREHTAGPRLSLAVKEQTYGTASTIGTLFNVEFAVPTRRKKSTLACCTGTLFAVMRVLITTICSCPRCVYWWKVGVVEG